MDIGGAVAVVTGAGNGMGLAMAREFGRRGAHAIVLADIDPAAAERAAHHVSTATGCIAVSHQCDVGREEEVVDLIATAHRTFGRIDLFCSHAGISDTNFTGLNLPTDRFRAMLDVNLLAHVWAAREVLPGMVERGRGHLVNTISATGLITGPSGPGYTFTKHGALGFAEWLALNYGHLGIGISALCPNAVYTGGFGAAAQDVMDDAPPPDGIGFGEIVMAKDVATLVADAVTENRFLILPHPRVGESFRRKGEHYDLWLERTRTRLQEPRQPEPYERRAAEASAEAPRPQ